jgi:hypothetical protein
VTARGERGRAPQVPTGPEDAKMDERPDPVAVLPDGVLFPVERRISGTILKLARPVKHGARELLELHFEPLTGAHVRRAPEDWKETDRVLTFAGQLTGLPDSVFDELGGLDVGEVIRTTLASAWPMLDLPVQWETVWRDLEGNGKPLRELPKFPGGTRLVLEQAIKENRDVVAMLEFSELTGRIARTLPTDGIPTARLPGLVSALTGAPANVVDKLTGRDLNRALALAQLFFLAIRGTSATSG